MNKELLSVFLIFLGCAMWIAHIYLIWTAYFNFIITGEAINIIRYNHWNEFLFELILINFLFIIYILGTIYYSKEIYKGRE